jgi:hypothetical protein
MLGVRYRPDGQQLLVMASQCRRTFGTAIDRINGHSAVTQPAPPQLTPSVRRGTLRRMAELPGGTVVSDVCGVLVDADKVSLHAAWHRTEDERLGALAQSLRELVEMVRGRRA